MREIRTVRACVRDVQVEYSDQPGIFHLHHRESDETSAGNQAYALAWMLGCFYFSPYAGRYVPTVDIYEKERLARSKYLEAGL